MLKGRLGRILAAGLVAGVLGLYAVLMGVLFAFGVGVTMSLPWWVALAGPALLYAVLAVVSLPGATAPGRAAAFGALCAVHALVALLTGLLVASVAGVPFAAAIAAASLSFLPAPLLQVLAVPLALLPLRSLVVPAPRAHSARRPEAEFVWSRPRQETVPGWEAGRLAAGVGGSIPSGSFPAPRPPAARAVDPLPVPLERIPLPGVAPVPVTSAAPPAAFEAPAVAVVAAPALVEAEPVEGPPSGADLRPEPPAEDTVAISFERIASALPGDLFACGVDEIPGLLARPGQLLVPLRVVLPQLADGLVAVDWSEVMAQFPARAFKGSPTAVAARLPEGRLVLPLDEVVRRLPPEIFAMPTPGIDLGAIESFPMPFQPVALAPPLPEPPRAAAMPGESEAAVLEAMLPVEPTVAAEAMGSAGPAVPAEATVPVEPAVAAEAMGPAEPAVPAEAMVPVEPAVAAEATGPVEPTVATEPVLSDAVIAAAPGAAEPAGGPEAAIAAAPVVATAGVAERTGAAGLAAGAAPAEPALAVPEALEAVGRNLAARVAVEPSTVLTPVPVVVPEAAPVAAIDVTSVVESPAVASAKEARLASLTSLLTPVGVLAGVVAEPDGHTVYLFRPPLMPEASMLQAIGPARALLRAGARGADQLTIRFERGAIALTPLPDDSDDATLAVGAVPLDGSLALLEMLSLRARVSPPRGPAAAGTAAEPLERVPGGPAADLLAGALGAFGVFEPSVVRDPAGRVELCLLLPAGEESRTLGALAHATCCALGATDGAALGPVQSAVLRIGSRRLALRPVAGRPGHWIALAAPEGDARPGLVQLEMARAAARVGAR